MVCTNYAERLNAVDNYLPLSIRESGPHTISKTAAIILSHNTQVINTC